MPQLTSRNGGPADRRPLPLLLTALLRDSTVLDAAVEAARARSGPQTRLPRPEVRRHVTVFVEMLMAAASGSDAALQEAGRAADRLAVDGVDQGISLPALLDGVGAGRGVVVTGLLASGRDRIGAEAMLSLVPALDAAAAAAHDRIVTAFRDAEVRRARTTRSRRADALRHLLAEGSAIWAHEAGLDPDGEYHVLVSDLSTPAPFPIPAPLPHPDVVSARVDGVACTLLTDLPADTADVLGVPGLLGVVSPAVRPGDVPAAYAHGRLALEARRSRGATGLHRLPDLVLDVAAARAPWLGELLRRELMAGVNPADERHRTLVATALAHLESGCRGDVTARRLHVHRNTVKYRLRQLQELLPAQAPPVDGENLLAQVKLWWALSTWQAQDGAAERTPT